MSNNLIKIIIGAVIIIVLSSSGILLLNHLNKKNPDSYVQYTPEEKRDIYEAIQSGRRDDYEAYLNDGRKLSFAFSDGSTPLEKLIESSDILSANKVVDSGFDLTLVENNHIDTVTNILAYNEDFDIEIVNDITIILIQQIKGEIEKPDNYGYSLLINAIETNNLEIVREILKHVKDVNKVYNGETAFTYATTLGIDNLDIIKELVNAGSDINFQGDEDYNGLMNAISYNNNELLRYLLSLENIDVNAVNDLGQSLLHLCVEFSNLDAVDIILQNSNINRYIKDHEGLTAKEYAVELKMVDFINKL